MIVFFTIIESIFVLVIIEYAVINDYRLYQSGRGCHTGPRPRPGPRTRPSWFWTVVFVVGVTINVIVDDDRGYCRRWRRWCYSKSTAAGRGWNKIVAGRRVERVAGKGIVKVGGDIRSRFPLPFDSDVNVFLTAIKSRPPTSRWWSLTIYHTGVDTRRGIGVFCPCWGFGIIEIVCSS